MNQIEDTLLTLVTSQNFLPKADPITGSASIIPTQLVTIKQLIVYELNQSDDEVCACGTCTTQVPNSQEYLDDQKINTDMSDLLTQMKTRITT